jgi:hypothetical protein
LALTVPVGSPPRESASTELHSAMSMWSGDRRSGGRPSKACQGAGVRPSPTTV